MRSFIHCPKYVFVPYLQFPDQVLKILDGVEIAPGTQIFTGQTGTTQIPGAFPTATISDDAYGSRVRDGEGDAFDDSDRKPDERGGKPEHPAEFYSMPPPANLTEQARA